MVQMNVTENECDLFHAQIASSGATTITSRMQPAPHIWWYPAMFHMPPRITNGWPKAITPIHGATNKHTYNVVCHRKCG